MHIRNGNVLYCSVVLRDEIFEYLMLLIPEIEYRNGKVLYC